MRERGGRHHQPKCHKPTTVQILSSSIFIRSPRAGIMPSLFRTPMIRPHNREHLCRRYASAHIHCRTT
ncbi:hypothetical protein F7234_20650 [Pseudomonas putida]|uniref:Uncharacterized protein n=1 Tax=Pseudomonas putida TaxID=303 RepID=A0AAD0L9T6_PSEPU|nr:hypothetical protein C1S65_23485 [Pseudomonas putida]KAB5620849.1 hypothetical protein F7234_20650 [Pseudomonas putida]